jgi:hypothetical protein
MVSADEIAALFKPGPLWRVERGTIVADVAPTPAQCRVELPEGRVISAHGAAVAGTYVDVLTDGSTARLLSPVRAGGSWSRTSGQSVDSGSQTTITWTTETLDTHGYLSPTSGTVTIPAGMGGLYAISVALDAAAALGGRCYAQITAAGRIYRTPFTSPGEDLVSVSATVPLASGDTISVAMYHASGSTIAFKGALDVYRASY